MSTQPHGFDADAKAKAREDAPVTIGAQTFRRRRKVWPVQRGLRSLFREQERFSAQLLRLEREEEKLEEKRLTDAVVTELEGIAEKKSDVEEKLDDLAYRIVAFGLHPDGSGPEDTADVEHLKANLAQEEVSDLVRMIAGAGEPDPSPAPTTEATATT